MVDVFQASKVLIIAWRLEGHWDLVSRPITPVFFYMVTAFVRIMNLLIIPIMKLLTKSP